MYVTRVPNRSSPPAVLLRESYRHGGKVKSKRCSDPIFRAVAREGMMRDHEHPSI